MLRPLNPAKLPAASAGVIAALTLALFVALAQGRCALAQPAPQLLASDDGLRAYAVHINRTPPQRWPGYGMYLGNGLILTAAHVPGNFAETKPRAVVAGEDRPTSLVRQGALDSVDLTLLSVDASTLPVRLRMRRLPLCEQDAFAGESVAVVTPERAVRSHVLPPSAVPEPLRRRFATVIGDVATTGNSGSGVIDVRRTCLLGIISRKISVGRTGARLGDPAETTDIAKYFVPVGEIRAFIPGGVSF
jgi:hypothetical protein